MAKLETEEVEQEPKADSKEQQTGIIADIADVSDWDTHMIYLYRIKPYRPGSAKNPYICKYSEKVDEETLKLAWGSGQFYIRLNRQLKNGKSTTIGTGSVEIIDPKFPPVLIGYDGWENDPRNKEWLWALKKDPIPSTMQGQGLSANDVMNLVDRVLNRIQPKTDEEKGAVTTAVIDAIQKGHATAIDMITKQVDAQSPDKVVAMITALRQFVKEEKPDTPNPVTMMKELSGSLKDLVALARPLETNGVSSFKEMASALKEIVAIAKPDTPPANAVEQTVLTKFMERALDRVLGDESGGGSGLGGKWDFWAEAIRQGAPALRDIVHDAFSAWQLAKLGGGWTPGAAPSAGMGGGPRGGPGTGPAFAAALPGPAAPRGEATPSSQPGPGPAPQPTGAQPPDPRMQVLAQVAPGFLNHLTGGSSGDAFAQWVEGGYGALAYDQLASFGVDGLLDVLKTSPFWSQLAPLENRVREFLTDFIDYGKDEGDEDGSEPSGPPDAPPAVEIGKTKGGRK